MDVAAASFNWLDGLLLTAAILFMVLGALKGLAAQLLEVAAIILALLVSALIAPPLAELSLFDPLRGVSDDAPAGICYIVVFLAAVITFGVLARKLTRRAPVPGTWKAADHALGGLLGAAAAVLIIGGLCIGLMSWRRTAQLQPVRQSWFAPRLAVGCESLVLLVPERSRRHFRELAGATLRRDAPGSTTHADPPPPTQSTTSGSSTRSTTSPRSTSPRSTSPRSTSKTPSR